MVKVIIASHHKLADGMGDTLKYLVPSLTDIETLSAYLDNEPIDSAVEAVAEIQKMLWFSQIY